MPDTLEAPARPDQIQELASKDAFAQPSWAPERSTEQAPRRASSGDYRPFDNVESRNRLQERFELPLMLRALRLPRGGRVLEVGCGGGVALPVLSEWLEPAELVGLDIDATLMERAHERIAVRHVAATLHVGDVRDLPFVGGRFDLVLDFGTCYHVSGGPTGRLTALNEISRVLRVGGLLVHETRLAQRLAHPLRSLRRSLPWTAVPMLARDRSAVLWGARRRVGPALT
ncbi:MAG: class I SAM-dependent methyltransferase [bacterium]